MIRMENCTIENCGSAFGLAGDVELNIDGLDVINCGTVYDIESERSNINAHAKNINVKNTDTYIKVGGNPTVETTSKSNRVNNTSRAANQKVLSNDNYVMRIALQYISATSNG